MAITALSAYFTGCNNSSNVTVTGLADTDSSNSTEISSNGEDLGNTDNPNPDYNYSSGGIQNNCDINGCANTPSSPETSGSSSSSFDENSSPNGNNTPTSGSSSSDETLPSSSSAVQNGNATYKYYGAELTGINQFKYGRFEARMKMVSFPGTVSSMFLNYDDSWKRGTEPWNEIDIEVLGKSKKQWQSNILTREGNPSIENLTASEELRDITDVTANFHLYAIIWTPEYVAWEIDSVEVRRVEKGVINGSHADKDQVAFLTKNQSLRFNLWASHTPSWTGKFTGEELAAGPQIQWIDYVRVYSYNEHSKTFTQMWQDDFNGNSLDGNHWTKGDWEMEETTHSPENIVVEGGYCKLMMTRKADQN